MLIVTCTNDKFSCDVAFNFLCYYDCFAAYTQFKSKSVGFSYYGAQIVSASVKNLVLILYYLLKVIVSWLKQKF